jgi:glucose/arabinose dehydrogenase
MVFRRYLRLRIRDVSNPRHQSPPPMGRGLGLPRHMSKKCRGTACAAVLLSMLAGLGWADADMGWQDEWAVQEGFSLTADSEGYHYPTAIAFVPNPGPDPKDPLYFVTELRGKVSVVTNDRSVFVFAEGFFEFKPSVELPLGFEGQGGLAGICLDPSRGYVFVTFIYRNDDQVIRNGLVRFEAEPQSFGIEPHASQDFSHIFSRDAAGVTHQIGACRVESDMLYVGTGDAWRPQVSQELNSTLGKILRMTVNGEPVPDNPYYSADNAGEPESYVWAYGFRNPFGLRFVNERLFVAENGVAIDRFLEVHRGANYLWDGTDESIATNAAVVFPKAVAPVHVEFLDPAQNLFPEEYAGSFYISTAGGIRQPVREIEKDVRDGVLRVTLDFETNRVTQVPEQFVGYVGTEFSPVAAVALGPDGLYFAPLYPSAGGKSYVFAVRFDPQNEHARIVGRPVTDKVASGRYLVNRLGCLGCHQIDGVGGTAALELDTKPLIARVRARLESDTYRQNMATLAQLDNEQVQETAQMRETVARLTGEPQIRAWITHQIHRPGFDALAPQMPDMGLTLEEAEMITAYLIDRRDAGFLSSLRSQMPALSPRRIVGLSAVFTIGLVVGIGFWALVGPWFSSARRRSGA